MWKTSRTERFTPNPARTSRAVFANKFIEKRKRSRQRNRLSQRYQSLPHLKSGLGFMNRCEKIKRLEICIYIGGKHPIEQRVYIMIGSPCSRNGQRQYRRVRPDSQLDLDVALRPPLFPKQKIPVVPSDLCGERVNGLRVFERIARIGIVPRRFIRSGEIHPVVRGKRVIVDCSLKILDGFVRVAGNEIQLPESSQNVPSLAITGFQRGPAFNCSQPV